MPDISVSSYSFVKKIKSKGEEANKFGNNNKYIRLSKKTYFINRKFHYYFKKLKVKSNSLEL